MLLFFLPNTPPAYFTHRLLDCFSFDFLIPPLHLFTMSNGEDKSLLERVEFPIIPVEAQGKIARLQEEFIRAEVQQRKSFAFLFF